MTGRRQPYVRVPATETFWDEHWEAETFDHLMAVAQTSPLTRFLERHVHAGDRVLEGGCGLGQYVVHFGRRGATVTGVDYAARAVERHRARFPGSDVRVIDLERLPFDDGTFDVYVSLGVIEHYEDGPGALFEEARRVLRSGGRFLVSTPYLNASRRLFEPVIARRQRAAEAEGARFYQYAFDERWLDSLLRAHGFEVIDRAYYDPGRGLRDLRDLARPWRAPAPRGVKPPLRVPTPHAPLKRRVLYSRHVLRSLAHMQIVHARVPGSG